jgi:hypothetical protein
MVFIGRVQMRRESGALEAPRKLCPPLLTTRRTLWRDWREPVTYRAL